MKRIVFRLCMASIFLATETAGVAVFNHRSVLRRNFGKVNLLHVAASNATVILRCEPPVGSPPPNITWYKNGEPFFRCGRSLSAKSAENVELIIKGVRANDPGDYQCVAENMAARRKGPLIRLEVRANRTCSSDEFSCGNGKCTKMDWRCDGVNDCEDFSDEIACCAKSCPRGPPNIDWTCIVVNDCEDFSDEIACCVKSCLLYRRPVIHRDELLLDCPVGEFQCEDSSRCIPKSKYCDGYKDCRNGEDEKSCAKKTCQPDEFTCKNGACTKMNFKCDGHDDCGDNSDETDCPPPSSEDTTVLVFGSQDGLYEIDLRNKSRMTRISKKIVSSFDFPSEPSQIYWSDGKRIYQLSLHNGNNEAVKFRPDVIKSVASLALDGRANKLYWTDTLQGAIYVGDLKNDRTVKLMEENLESPRAIVLSKGYLYFADSGRKPKIERARLDGSKRKTLFIFDSNLVPNGLALDETRNKLYCAGTDLAGYGVIGVITLSDLNITFIFQRDAGYRPFGLDIFEEHVYWTDLGKKALLRINKSSGTGMEVIISDLNKPKGLKILQRSLERLGRNSTQDYDNRFPSTVARMDKVVAGGTCVYKNGGCEHLCLNLLHPTERKCLCEEGFRLGKDGKTCEMFLKGQLSVPGEEKEEMKGEPWIAVTCVLSTLSLLFVLFLGGIAVKKLLSCSRQRGLPDVLRMALRKESNDTEMEPMNGPVASDTNIMHADPHVDNTTDASPEWNQQVCSAESTGACAVSEDLPLQVQVQGDVVVYNTVNMMNTVHMNNTNNVELQQSGGVTVVGDEAKVNYHQPPTS